MTKVDAMKVEMEKQREIYENMPKEEPEKLEVTSKQKEEKNKEPTPFMPIPIQNEIDEEVLSYAGEMQGPVEKRPKLIEDAADADEEAVEGEQEPKNIRVPIVEEEIPDTGDAEA